MLGVMVAPSTRRRGLIPMELNTRNRDNSFIHSEEELMQIVSRLFYLAILVGIVVFVGSLQLG